MIGILVAASKEWKVVLEHFNIDKIIVIGTCAGVDVSNKLLDVIIPNKVLQSDVTFMEKGEAPKEDFIVELREIMRQC